MHRGKTCEVIRRMPSIGNDCVTLLGTEGGMEQSIVLMTLLILTPGCLRCKITHSTLLLFESVSVWYFLIVSPGQWYRYWFLTYTYDPFLGDARMTSLIWLLTLHPSGYLYLQSRPRVPTPRISVLKYLPSTIISFLRYNNYPPEWSLLPLYKENSQHDFVRIEV